MKKRFIFFTLLLLNAGIISACDICGCSGAGMTGGLFPQVQQNMFGVRGFHQSYTHPVTSANMNGLSQVKKDNYLETDIFFRWYVSKKFQLWFNLPLRQNTRVESLRTTTLKGPGDLQLRGYYTLTRTSDSVNSKFRHLLLVGAGLGLPTGKYQQRDETLTMLPNGFQIGSGSYSFQLSCVDIIQTKKTGLQLQYDYTTYTTNEQLFRRGDQHNFIASLFYKIQLKRMLILPQLGTRMEIDKLEEEYSQPRLQSGGKSSWANANLDFYGKGWMAGCGVQLPYYQALPETQPSAGPRFSVMAGITW